MGSNNEKVTVSISSDVYEKLKDELTEESAVVINTYADMIGKKVFVRTVTYHLLGEVTKQVGNLVFLKNASWVADSGRFMQFIKDGSINEVEPVGDWFFNIETVVDGCIWKHSLPTQQK